MFIRPCGPIRRASRELPAVERPEAILGSFELSSFASATEAWGAVAGTYAEVVYSLPFLELGLCRDPPSSDDVAAMCHGSMER